jgi:amino acid adenylation domain-containing protein
MFNVGGEVQNSDECIKRLSYGQRSLWFLHHLAPEGAAYNIAAAARLLSPIEPDMLERALQALVERHAALRTTFPANDGEHGEPCQRIAEDRCLSWSHEDATGWDAERLRSRLAEEAWRPFDLASGPLLRVTLWTGGAGSPLILLVIHHIIADFGSLAILMRELPALYREAATGEPARLPPPGLAYEAHVRFEREIVEGRRGEELLAFWRERLAGLPALELAADRPRPAVQTYRGDVRRLRLPGELAAALRARSRTQHGTLFMTLTAVFQALLSRHSGQEDLAIGAPRAGRAQSSRSGFAGTVGYFVNQVVLRGDLSGDPTFAELLERTKAMVHDAFSHGDYPLPLLAERLQPVRDASRTPLFQVSFVLQKETRGAEGLTAFALGEDGVQVGPEDFRLESLSLPRPPAPFDLVLHAVERQGGLSLGLQFNTDLFDATTAERLLEHFERLLAGAATDPGQRLSELPLLAPSERAQLLGEWNDTAQAFPETTLDAEVRRRAERHPELPAVVSAEEALTYGELAGRAGELAQRLRALGVGPEVPVALHLERSAAMVTAILGVLEAGGAYLPLDPSHPAERLAAMLEDAGRPLLVTERRLAGALTGAARDILWLDETDGRAAPAPVRRAAPENLAYILHTSGSTGKPKGVCCSHRGVLNLLADFARRQPLAPGSRGSLWTSLSFDVSVYEIFSPLLAGGAVHIVPEAIRQDAERFLDWLIEERIESAYVPPFLVAALRDRLERMDGGASLRRLLVGVEPIPEPLLVRIAQLCPGLAVINGYGPTEATICAALYAIDPRRDRFGQPPITPIGRPAAGYETYLLGRHREPVPLGVPGELCIAGVGLARGYWKRPEATAERFVPHPWSTSGGERLYRTGDLARLRPDGNLEFLGRIDHQIKLRGFRIEPGEIEAALLAHPAVREAVVTAWPPAGLEGREQRRLVAYVVGAEGGAPSGHDLREHLRDRLPAYMVPAVFVSLPALPLTPNGKLDRRALPDPGLAVSEPTGDQVPPRTPTEELVAGIFAEVLGADRIGAEDSFFERGGHSLAALRLMARVRQAFGVDLPLHRVFEVPTVAGLAAAIEAAARSGAPVLPPLIPVEESSRLLSFAQQRLWFLHQLAPESPAYNVPAAVHLRGDLDRAALSSALAELARRHETLRTRFAAEQGRPIQIVDPPAPVPVPEVDFASLPGERRLEEAGRLAREEALRPFDLERGPLLRAALAVLGDGEHLLLLTLHHIVSDGWSLRVLARELGEIYGAFAQGRPSPLPELEIQYGDYAVWQRRWLQGEVLETELAYWRHRLAGAPPVLDLPLDHPRTAAAGDRGASRSLALPPALLAALQALARQQGATLFMTLLAAFQALLSRVSGSADVSVGTPVAGRGQIQTEGLIGFFVNTLVMRTDLSGEPSFAGLLVRVREVALAAYAHQDLPFEKLVEELQPERGAGPAGDAPFFQVAFALEAEPAPSLRLGGVAADLWPLEPGAEKFDLSLTLAVEEEGLRGALGYRTALFDGTTIERLGGHFVRLLAEAVAHPERRLKELPWLSDGERQQLLVEWNDTRAPFPETTLLHQLFEVSVERAPEAVAAVCAGQELTYAELEARSNRLANLLRERGIGCGTPVGVWVERSFDMLTAVLGVLKVGGYYVALDEAWPADRVETILGRTGAPAIVVGPGLLGAIDEMRWRLPKLSDAVCLGIADPEPPAEAIDPESVRELWDFVAERAVDRVTAGGFISAFTGEPMSEAEVDEYRDRVLSLAGPWLRPEARALEIGNGSGLLLWEMASRVAHVTGIDPSPLTQERNREHAAQEGIGNVELLTGFAHEVDGLVGKAERFDLILLASTVQFFPGPRYLEQVVRWAQCRLAPGGAVLVADVLDARRREELRRAIEEAGGTDVARRQELFLDEDLFRDLGGIVHHRIEGFPNELRFRYDVLLTGQPTGACRKRLWTGWHVDCCPAARLPQVAAPDDLAYVIHTSGSTGEPKGIAVQHRPAAHLVDWVNRTFEIGPDDRGLFVTSLCFDLSVYDIFGVLGAGGTVYVATREELSDPDGLVGLLRSGGITLWDSAPAALVQLAPLFPAEPETGSRLRRVLLSGDWVPVTLPDRVRQAFPGAQVMALGGATEATVWSNWFPVGEVDPRWTSIPYGRPISNARYHVLDAGFGPCPIGVPGDLYIGGACLCVGYARRPDLTAQAFLPDPFSETPGARLYRTGDRARYQTGGNLEFLGRLDQQVKVRGYRIELGEIEVALARHPGVREAVVLVREDEPGDRRLVAYVVPIGDPPADLPIELKNALRRSLPESMIPSAFVMLDELPVTANGKLDRAALPAPRWSAGTEPAAPQTPTEEILAAIWSDVLGVARVGREDRFFDLGGHSLLATQMLARVRAACGVELPLRTLFERPKLADLAAWIEQAMPNGAPAALGIVRQPRSGPLPLSFSQRRLWFLDQMEPGSPLYNIAAAVELTGRPDLPVLAAALGEVVRRHEALRTAFHVVDHEPVQVIPEPAGCALPLIDLQGLPTHEREGEAGRLASAEARRPFDLSHPPLLRVTLLRKEPERHTLLLTMHHIVSDGWSMGVLVRELGTLYAAFLEGRPSPLPELAIQYPDFAAWQRRHLSGALLESELAWWRGQLAGLPPALELPADHPRPAALSSRGAAHEFTLGREVLAGLTEISRRHGATLFMALLAGFAALLQRVNGDWGQDGLAVGTPIAGRTRAETEPLIGLFVNTLVLRVDLSGDPDLAALLARVRETTLAAYAHQELPFERLVEDLAPERDLSRPPLVQALLALQNAPAGPLELPGLALTASSVPNGTSRLELACTLTETAQGLAGTIEYSRDLFEAPTIARLAEHFTRLLAAAAAEPHRRLSQLSVLSAAERHQALVEWSDAESAYPREACVHELFAETAAALPDAPAVVADGEVWTYRRLDEASNRLARHLQAVGVRPESRVCISLERSPELIVGILAILKAGGAYVPLDPGYPDERLDFMLADVGAEIILVHAPTRERLAGRGRLLIAVDAVDAALGGGAEGASPLDLRVPAEALAYVIYTSGSTGRPKGVAVPHRGVVRLVRNTNFLQLGPGDRTAFASTISFDAATWEIWGVLLNGAALVVIPQEALLSPAELRSRVWRDGVTHMHLTTAVFNQVFREAPQTFSPLRAALFGGEAADAGVIAEMLERAPEEGRPERLLHFYGPTEGTTFSTWQRLWQSGSAPIGRPVANTAVHVLDRWGAHVPIGVSGELHIGGDGLAWGYWNRPELTAERFVPDPFGDRPDRSDPSDRSRAGNRLYRTGDLVRHGPDGAIEFLGRLDHQVKIRGFRIEPEEIEAVLRQHPATREAAVAVLDGQLAAWADGDVTAAELRRFAQEKLPAYMVPSFFTVLPALPLTASGKVDRKALARLRPERRSEEPVLPRTPTEELLAGIFAGVLGLEQVGVEDSFFELGGHSLLATQIASRVRGVLGVELPVRAVFEAPTVTGLAAQIAAIGARAGHRPPPPLPLARAERSGPLPLSFTQERLWFLQQLEPGSAAYNMPFAVEISGRLDRGAFAAALDEIVRRHEALRTTFTVLGGAPHQWIGPARGLPLPLADLSALPVPARGAETERLEREHAGAGFDLERGPLVRGLLVGLSAETHRFLLSLHHIIADGWSLGVLVRELGALYGAFREGRPSPLPELPLQVADFAVWQREQLADRQEAQLAYWQARLGGEIAPAELPADRPRPAVQTYRGGRRQLVLSPELTARLQRFGRGEGATLFMTLLAAAQTLLSRHSGERDVTVGAPIAGRPFAEIEGLIGCFLNTLVLRTDLSGRPSFRELVSRVRTVTLEAYAHQDVPFEAVLAHLRLDRDLSRTPLFQVLFNMLSLPASDLALLGLDLRVLTPAEVPSKFDMTFYVSEIDRGVNIHLVYNADLFDEARMVDLLDQFKLLLAQAVERPDEPVNGLSLVTEWARALLPDPIAPLDAGWIGGVHELFAAQAERVPERPAVIEEDAVWSYGDLLAGSRGVAGWLAVHGVRPGDPVAVFAHRSAPLVQAVQGVLTAGAAFVILDPAYPAARLAEMLRLASPRAFVALEAAGPVPEAVQAWLDETGCSLLELPADGRAALESVAAFADEAPRGTVGPQDLACIGFTSGSTGGPKGVLGLHGSLSHFLPAYCAELGLGPDDRFSMLSGLSHDPLQRDIFTPLYLGAAIAVPDPADYGIAGRLAEWMSRERVTAAHLTPALGQLLTARSPHTEPVVVPSLRRAILIGEALTRQDVARLRELAPGVTCFNLYGATETQRALAFHRVTHEEGRQVLPLGRGFQDAQLLVINFLGGAGRLAGIGEIGEIAVRSPHLARGYLGDEALTAERFQLNPFTGAAGDRIYRTGDLGRYLPDGEVEFAGRADLQVKLRGFRIELSEIEAALAGHPAVQEAVVLLRQDLSGGSGLVAYVVPVADGAAGAAQLHDYLWQRLPAYMVPAAFVFLESLPRSPSGKIDRRALSNLEVMTPSASGERALRTPVEEIVAGLWAEVLGRGGIGPDDNFFQLGGHSLTGAQIVSRLRDVFQVELPLRVLFEAPTVAGLAAEVESRRRGLQGGGAPARPSIASFRQDRGAPPPLSFAQERFWAGRLAEARSVASTIPTLVVLDGDLDLLCLQRALQEVVDRHEVLRTCFREEAGRPVQAVLPVVPVQLRLVDLEEVAPPRRKAEIRFWSALDGQTHFDFEHGPIFRLTVFRCAPRENVLLFVVHHIAFDGWSRSVLTREVAALYNAFREGRPSPLRPLAIQYQDFARWQRHVLQGEALEREVGFWREQLRGASPVRLGNRQGHIHPTFEAGIEVFMVPAELERKLEAFAAAQGATLFMTFLAAFKALLHEESGRDDIVVTSLFANRNQSETESLIGNFFAGLPLRTRLHGVRTFRDLLARVRGVTLAALEHPDILYEPAMEGLSFLAPGERGGLATFRILFQLAQLPRSEQTLSGLELVHVPFDTGKIRQDLSLFIARSSRLGGRFKYNRDVLDRETVVRLRDRLLQILETVVADPDRPLSELLPDSSEVLAGAAYGETASMGGMQ